MERGDAAPITGISSMAMRHALAESCEAYERQSLQPVALVTVGGVEAVRRVRDGEPFDFVVLAADAIDQLAAAGSVDADTRTDLARSAVAIAVAAGATHPDVSSEQALRDAVFAARSIGCSTGPSGVHLARLFERWGIRDMVAPRLVQAPPGVPVGALVARGNAELGFQQLSELMHVPGIEIVGALPPGAELVTVFSAALCTASERRDATRALLSFLASQATDAVKLRHGMEPARAGV